MANKRHSLKISPENKERIYYMQGCVCIYCETELTLDTMIMEHVVPYKLCHSNKLKNIVGACRLCNYVKSTLLFKDLYDAIEYVRAKRFPDKYPDNVSHLPIEVYSKEDVAEILQPEVSHSILVDEARAKECKEALDKLFGGVGR